MSKRAEGRRYETARHCFEWHIPGFKKRKWKFGEEEAKKLSFFFLFAYLRKPTLILSPSIFPLSLSLNIYISFSLSLNVYLSFSLNLFLSSSLNTYLFLSFYLILTLSFFAWFLVMHAYTKCPLAKRGKVFLLIYRNANEAGPTNFIRFDGKLQLMFCPFLLVTRPCERRLRK